MTKSVRHLAHVRFLAITVIILLAFDQGSKFLAERFLRPIEEFALIRGVFSLQYVQNFGAAFGTFQNKTAVFCIFAAVISGIAVYAYLNMPKSRRFFPLRMVCCLLIAGALGNMADRLFRGYVVDFLYFSLIDFPVFNLADIYVTAGCFALILLLVFVYREDELKIIWKK